MPYKEDHSTGHTGLKTVMNLVDLVSSHLSCQGCDHHIIITSCFVISVVKENSTVVNTPDWCNIRNVCHFQFHISYLIACHTYIIMKMSFELFDIRAVHLCPLQKQITLLLSTVETRNLEVTGTCKPCKHNSRHPEIDPSESLNSCCNVNFMILVFDIIH